MLESCGHFCPQSLLTKACKPLHIQIVLSPFWASTGLAENPLYLAHETSAPLATNPHQKFPGLFIINHTTHSAVVQVAEIPHEYQILQLWGFFPLSTEGFIYFLRHSWYLSWHPACPLTLTYKLLTVSWPFPSKNPLHSSHVFTSHTAHFPPCLSFLKLCYPSITTFCNPSDVIVWQLHTDFQFPLFVSDAVGYSIVNICIAQPYLGLLHQLVKTNIFSALGLSGLKCHLDSNFLQKTTLSQFCS